MRTLFNNTLIRIHGCEEVEDCPVDIFYNILATEIYTRKTFIKEKCFSTPTPAEINATGNSRWNY